MNILIDMNLSPARVEEFTRHGFESAHWSTIGKPDAPDSIIIDWARAMVTLFLPTTWTLEQP